MTTEQHFNCIFCKDTFDNKEELQIHFRKHGDPKFKHNTKTTRSQIETLKDVKTTEDNELVGCDVCDEVFPTISKAITHKHKVHPDHDSKYFCSFCGKLFTMKHLYNKHIQTNHNDEIMVDKSDFHCDCCDVLFCGPAAMLHHNKFFHRQDSELPAIGQSRKVKHYVEHLIQIYYCAFCGEEYNNKVNLHKHMGEDHGDENQSPSEVLKCPLCDAVFYHLDAYELHLMFHSSEDMYSENTLMTSEVTEFSLETVPPIIEKVEDEQINEDTTVGIGDFLQLVMGDNIVSEDLGKIKSKKHKKRKKSKKAAITLDEFLNMNKDVFGDGLDVQGIEEVPSQVVLKKFKGKRPTNVKSKSINADINKLKKQGITVKSKTGKKTLHTKAAVKAMPGKDLTEGPEQEKSTITAPGDVLSKLMRQGNSQIKIVKKIVSQHDNKEAIPLINNIETAKSEPTSQISTNHDIISRDEVENDNNDKNKYLENSDEDYPQSKSDNEDIPNNSVQNFDSCDTDNAFNNKNLADVVSKNIESSIIDKTSIRISVDDADIPNSDLNMSTDLSYKALGNINSKSPSHIPNTVPSIITNKDELNESNDNGNEEYKDTYINAGNNAMSALKHLSHLITVKSIKNNKMQSTIHKDMNEKPVSDDTEKLLDEKEKSCDNVFKAPEAIPKKNTSRPSTTLPSKSCEALKNISQQVTVKSVTSNQSMNTSSDIDCNDEDANMSDDNETVKNPNQHITLNNSNRIKISGINNENKNITNEEWNDESLLKQQTNNEIIRRLTNVTTKAMPSKKSNHPIALPFGTDTSIKSPIQTTDKKSFIDENIEIFSVDDSDSEDASDEYVNTKSSATEKTQSSSNVINNLGRDITVKSYQQKSNVNDAKNKQANEEKQIPINKEYKKVKMHSSEIQKSINLQNTLKNLGSNITVKPRSSAAAQDEDEYKDFEDMNEENDQYDSDPESNEGQTTKITEITDPTSDIDYDSNDEYDSNVLVQSPEEHIENECKNYDDDEEAYTDIESQIQSNTVTKISQFPKSPGLENFKSCNRDITIKPVIENKIKNDGLPSPPLRKEIYKPKLSNKVITNKTNNVTSCQNNLINQRSSPTVNESNTVKTVQKIQTQTVIQEITTVTKTIRTVNESTNSVIQRSSQTITRPQKFLNKNRPGNEHHGKIVRHLSPALGRGTSNIRQVNTAQIRPANQVVAIRAATTPIRLPTPTSQVIKKSVPAQKNIIGKLKISPNLINKNMKRPSETNSSPCKKYKETSSSSFETTAQKSYDDTEPYSVATTSQSNFSSSTEIIKGNAAVMTSQTKSEVSINAQQQLNRLSGMCGLKIVKTSTKHFEEKSEISVPQRNTMEALEKLQRHGLLVKKPRIDYNEEPEQNTSFSESDDDANYPQ